MLAPLEDPASIFSTLLSARQLELHSPSPALLEDSSFSAHPPRFAFHRSSRTNFQPFFSLVSQPSSRNLRSRPPLHSSSHLHSMRDQEDPQSPHLLPHSRNPPPSSSPPPQHLPTPRGPSNGVPHLPRHGTLRRRRALRLPRRTWEAPRARSEEDLWRARTGGGVHAFDGSGT